MTRPIAFALAILAAVLPAQADPLTDLVRQGEGVCFSRQFGTGGASRGAGQTVRSVTLAITRAASLKPGDPTMVEITVILTRFDREGLFAYRATCVDPLPNGAACIGYLSPGSAEEAGDTSVTLGEGARSARLSLESGLKFTPLGEAVSRVVVLPFGSADGDLELTAAPMRTCAVLDGAAPN